MFFFEFGYYCSKAMPRNPFTKKKLSAGKETLEKKPAEKYYYSR